MLQLDVKENPIIASHSKNKRRLKWRDKIQISEKCGKPVPKPAKTKGLSVGPGLVSSTHRFFRTPFFGGAGGDMDDNSGC